MGYKVFDFECLNENCNNLFEDMVEGDSKVSSCPLCGSVAESVLTAAKLGTFAMADQETKKKILLERSNKHTKKEVNKEPERFGLVGDKGKMRKIVRD